MNVKLQFISNNVKGLQSSLKRIKVFEYQKNNLGSNGCFFCKKPIHP